MCIDIYNKIVEIVPNQFLGLCLKQSKFLTPVSVTLIILIIQKSELLTWKKPKMSKQAST